MSSAVYQRFVFTALMSVWCTVAYAHVGHGATDSGGFLAGALHPVTGLDHVVAMVAVGLWGAQLGAPAIWVLPVTFPLVMAIGGFFGVIGVPMPGVEAGVALSGVVLGLLVVFAARPPLWVAAIVVAAFAVFHGHTHGTALPLSGVPLAYGAGFVIATGLLHVCGIVIGLLNHWPIGERVIRAGGAFVAMTGFVFLGIQLGMIGR